MYNKTKRDVFHDTHSSTLDDRIEYSKVKKKIQTGYVEGSEGTTLPLSETDFDNLFSKFLSLGKALQSGRDVGFNFNEQEYTFRYSELGNSTEGTVIYHKDTSYLRAELSYVSNSDSEQKHINLTYTMYMHNKNGPVISFIGNPTTILNGNNIRPVRFEGVSRFHENLMFYQIAFYLLEHMFEFKFSKIVRRTIKLGDFKTANSQLVMLFGSTDKALDIGLLSSLYCSRLGARKKSKALGEYLGFSVNNVYPDLSGVFLTKKQGNNPYLTINVYDKTQSVKNKKQGRTLTSVEKKVINETLRFDITLHSTMLESIIKEAMGKVPELCEIQPAFRKKLYGKEEWKFIQTTDNKKNQTNKKIRVTANRICRAMQILSLEIKDGKIYNVGFSKYLIDRILDKELKLIPILEFNPSALNGPIKISSKEAKTEREKTVIEKLNNLLDYWKSYKGTDIISDYYREYNIGLSSIYRYRQEIRNRLKIDISVPYEYWLDFDIVNIAYGLSTKDKVQLRDIIVNSDNFDSEELGNRLKKLTKKSNSLKKTDAGGLLSSIKMVARQITAKPFDHKLITKN